MYCVEKRILPFFEAWRSCSIIAFEHFLSFADNCVIVVQAGRALGDLKSVRELYDFKTLVVLFLIGSVAVVPTILKRKRTYE